MRTRVQGGRDTSSSQTIFVPKVKENLEGIIDEIFQGEDTKTHLPIKNREFEKLLFKFDHREEVRRTTKD
jgi:hypothetical protein